MPRCCLTAVAGLLLLTLLLTLSSSADQPPPPPRIGEAGPRTGTTGRYGSGTLTRRSDGSSSRTQPFGSGSIERDQPGRKGSSSRP